MIREPIEKIIRDNQDTARAAIEVCLYLEDTIDLEGNGWFEGDDIMRQAFREAAERRRAEWRRADGVD